MPVPTALVPLVALAALVAGTVLAARRLGRPRPSDFAWLAVPAAALVALAVWCARGLYTGETGDLALFSLASLAAAASALLRDRALAALRARIGAGRAEALVAAIALLACCALGFLAIEVPYNETFSSIAPQFVAIEGLLVLGLLATLYFLFQRHGAGIALGVGLCAVTGLAQYFVAAFKASAILPNDLLVLGTAAAVSGGYVYALDGDAVLGLACLMLACALSALVRPAPPAEGRVGRRRGRSVVANLAGAAACAVALALGVTVPSYFDDLGVGMEYWYSLDYYERQGFLTTFVAVAQDLPIDVPEGYSAEGAAATEADYAAAYDGTLGATEARAAAEAQFAEERPSVICIMNESFADLSSLDGATWGYAGTTRYQAIDDALARADLNVSVMSAGTCNTEFEFLTGVPLAYVGDGKYPYSLYDLSSAPSLARQFSELGYSTTALHPNFATNWNRDRVYRALGFDEFLSIEDFEGAETYHSGVSDAETYDKVLELLEASDDPQFIFDVTMQNHSGYDQNNLGDVPQYEIDGLSDYDNARLSEYVACAEESDRALAEFLDELRELDRPVVVIFFGDHQPSVASVASDALYPGEDELTHSLRTYHTTYLVWANYDVAGAEQASGGAATSPAYLGALTAQAIGAPLTDYQKTQLVAHESMPSLTLVGYQDAGGAWHRLDERSEASQAFDDLARVTYLEFGSTV